MRFLILVLISLILTFVEAANILGVFPIPMKSHQRVFNSLIEALAERGHSITTITTDPIDQKKYPNLHQIDVHNTSYPVWDKTVNYARMSLEGSTDFKSTTKAIIKGLLDVTEAQLNLPEVKKMLGDPSVKFDVCLIECWVEPLFAFKDSFNCSLILVSSTSGSFTNYDAFGNPSNPTLYMDVVSPYFGDLDFWKRLHLTYIHLVQRYSYHFWILPKYNYIIKKHFGNDARSMTDLHNDADLMFVYGHPILSGNRPVVPGIIHIDSVHIKPVSPLPQKFENIINNSTEDVIYFSFGSNVKTSLLNGSLVDSFLNAFNELPYTILMKWENETLQNKPSNVHVFDWMPQQDILAHPKVKAFISQGGYQSLEEAIHYKVPIIGLPFIMDQNMNVMKLVKFGIGIGLNVQTVSKDLIKKSILEVINNSSYRKNIEVLSNLIDDQPQKPLDRAVWWTEYVIRNKGAKHLKSASTEVSFVEYFLLDVIMFISIVICIFLFSVIWLIVTIKSLFSKKIQAKEKLT